MTKAEKIQALQAEARAEAQIACNDFAARLQDLAAEAAAIAGMGDAAPVGVRELASRLSAALPAHATHIKKLLG